MNVSRQNLKNWEKQQAIVACSKTKNDLKELQEFIEHCFRRHEKEVFRMALASKKTVLELMLEDNQLNEPENG